jgi:SNF2 family DNA or RNA helicase
MKLYPFQTNILKASTDKNRVAYFLDMGLGKTFVGAEKLFRLGNRVNLVICQKSKIADWKRHFETNYPYNFHVYDLTKGKQFDEYMGKVINEKYHVIGIINYELAWRRKAILDIKDFTLLLDESSLIQNRKAKQSKFILKLNPANVILLSGTPTSGKYENLWTQIHLLGWDIKEPTYNTQYVNWKKLKIGWGPNAKLVPVVDKLQPYKNVERLKTKMREHGAIFMKTEEVLELPEQVITEIEINVSKEYRKFQKDSIITVRGAELVGDTDLTKRLYSRQLCGQYSEEKLEAFRDLIEYTNDRVIVFYNINEELETLRGLCDALERPVSVINGTVKDLSAYEQNGDSITLVQYQAGAMGLNLQLANKVVYFTLPDGRQDLFDQSMKRVHRIGQNRTCFYYILLCRDSVEEDILKTLNIRKEYTDELFKEGE